MPKIIYLNESTVANFIIEQSMANLYDPYSNKIKASKESLNNLLFNYGKIMINIENGRDYLVYYAKGISNAIGKTYAICRVIGMDGEPFGSVYIKPYELFRNKY